ncbi:PACE efflux transporter [Pelistega sp. NLN82]|uniref:PACE efflux transporter n=1 Tax=Pelistega ratti TaxID=2652177 RepID=A0A6L9Y6D2_9BURK|nr:PACE efflux transporter [Pelistega ratti]NEN75941.1 PACE efflux transporter [Pelistega ratti]
MSSVNAVYRKSVAERFLYAFLFEVLGITISAPLGAWVFNHSLFSMGVVTVVIALMALLLNMFYNTVFDFYLLRKGYTKTKKIRVCHAIGFEITLFLMTIPFIAWYLGVSIWEAIVLDIVFILFYLPYTYLFNLCYDIVRSKIVKV